MNLSEEVTKEIYYKIVEFLQLNNWDSNNKLVDKFYNEKDKQKKKILLNEIKINSNVDFNSTGYICQLFKFFNKKNFA